MKGDHPNILVVSNDRLLTGATCHGLKRAMNHLGHGDVEIEARNLIKLFVTTSGVRTSVEEALKGANFVERVQRADMVFFTGYFSLPDNVDMKKERMRAFEILHRTATDAKTGILASCGGFQDLCRINGALVVETDRPMFQWAPTSFTDTAFQPRFGIFPPAWIARRELMVDCHIPRFNRNVVLALPNYCKEYAAYLHHGVPYTDMAMFPAGEIGAMGHFELDKYGAQKVVLSQGFRRRSLLEDFEKDARAKINDNLNDRVFAALVAKTLNMRQDDVAEVLESSKW